MRKVVFFLIVLFVWSCSGVQKANKIKDEISTSDRTIYLDASGDKNISVTYTGCGGFLIQDDSISIMLDPYFSNLSPLISTYFKKLQPDTHLIDGFFEKRFGSSVDEKGRIKSILIAHSHYDHLADVPTIYHRNFGEKKPEIYGGLTTHNLMQYYDINTNVITLNERVSAPIHMANGRIQVIAIKSEHAPHIAGIKLLPSNGLSSTVLKEPQKIKKMPEGESYNYLIDIQNI